MLVKSVTRSILCLAAVASALPQGPRPAPGASQLQALGSSRGHQGTGFNPAAVSAHQAMNPDDELQGAADEWDQGPDEDAEVPDSGAGGYSKPDQTYGGGGETPDEPVTPPSGGYDQPEQTYGGDDTPEEPIDQPPSGGYDQPDQTYGGGGVPDEPIDQPDQTYGGGGGGGYGGGGGGYGGGGGGFGGGPGGFGGGAGGFGGPGGGFGGPGGLGPNGFPGGGFPGGGIGGGFGGGFGPQLPPPGFGGGVPAFGLGPQAPCNSPFCGIPNLQGPPAIPAPVGGGGFLKGVPVLGGFLGKKK